MLHDAEKYLITWSLKKKIYQPSTSTDIETLKNKAKPITEEVRNHITWYNGQQFDYTEGFIRNKKNFLIGMPRIKNKEK